MWCGRGLVKVEARSSQGFSARFFKDLGTRLAPNDDVTTGNPHFAKSGRR